MLSEAKSLPRAAAMIMRVCLLIIHANSLRESPAPHPRAPRRAVLGGILTAPQWARAQSPYDAAFAASTKLDADAFYAEHPYRSASDVLDYIEKCAAPGDASAVLRAFEYFGKKYPMYSIGATKGKILDSAVATAKPRRIVEIGSFLGYSAVRMAAKLPADGMLACVEGNAEFARTAEGVVARAGLSDRVRFFVGLAADEIPGVAKAIGRADLVFLDHCKECYAPDLERMEAAGLVAKGTVVVADNVVFPGAPGYLDKVAAPAYATVLRPAPYEAVGWETRWKEVDDAMSISTRL
jgi:predicted O-methyltransferase YrrM